jgi:endonuclease YncB( thermonuclease family)
MARILVLCLLLLTSPAHGWPARVVEVTDGDTLVVEPPQGGERSKVRLHGIDTPERRQPYGEAATAFTRQMVLYRQVDVQPTPQGKDRYGRMVALVVVAEGETLQEMLLDAGLAWVYPRFCKDCKAWEAKQDKARKGKHGLWKGNAVPPWEWRKK